MGNATGYLEMDVSTDLGPLETERMVLKAARSPEIHGC
jgi:hypothetical protein